MQWLKESNIVNGRNLRVLPSKKDLIKLTELDLSQYKITELPKEIFNLTNLTTLDLSWNQLTEIPKEIDNLTNLSIRFKKFV